MCLRQAAAALEAFSLVSPSKPSHKDMDALPVIDDRKRSVSPDSEKAEGAEVEEEEDLDELRKKFVGEVDLPESQLAYFATGTSTLTYFPYKVKSHCSKSQSVALSSSQFNTTRFVTTSPYLSIPVLISSLDMANVQEGRGILLDR